MEDFDAMDSFFEVLEIDTEIEKRKKYLREYTQTNKERDKDKNRARLKKWRKDNQEKSREQDRRKRQKSLGIDLLKTRAKDRDKKLKHRFGISIEKYYQILSDQNNGCAICGIEHNGKIGNKHKYNTSEDLDRNKLFSVDHDHKTGGIRGLLCTKHNNGLGCFDDDIDLLEKAIKYLKKYRK